MLTDSCFCLPEHVSEDVQVPLAQLHSVLCPLENVSMLCAIETKCGILKKKTLFSVIKFHSPLFLTYTILVGLITAESLNQRNAFIEIKKEK